MSGYCYLCCACGVISPADEYIPLKYERDCDGDLVPAESGYGDPTLRCPACDHDHVDDDSNPGVEDGTRRELERIRERKYLPGDGGWAERWAMVWIDRYESAHNGAAAS